jgi:hypothetical protein
LTRFAITQPSKAVAVAKLWSDYTTLPMQARKLGIECWGIAELRTPAMPKGFLILAH